MSPPPHKSQITKHTKYANTQICVFLVRALPKVQDQIRKQFFDKVLYNYCSEKKLLSVLSKKNSIKKMDLPLHFQKVIWVGGDIFYDKKIF